MRLAHLADLHLGFRMYARTNPKGANQREADVAGAFRQIVDQVLEYRPDAIVIAGDVFHSIRPTNAAIMFLFAQLQRLRVALPDAPVVLIAGDHDTPRTSEVASILGLYKALGVDVATNTIERVRVPGLAITAVPQAVLGAGQGLEPEPGVLNVLVAHGEARNVPHQPRTVGDGLLSAGWDYVALGHWHVRQRVGERAWYCGASEYVSTDPWGEVRQQVRDGVPGKGWQSVELPDGEPEFHPITARLHVDLPRISGESRDGADVGAEILAAMVTAPDDAVVRLIVDDVSKTVRRDLPWAAMRDQQARFLHWHLDLRRPREEAAAVHRAAVFQQFDEVIEQHLKGHTERPDFPKEVDKVQFVSEGMRYVRGVKERVGQSADAND